MPYVSACKVALEYRTRFWEHYENPIYGGCSTSTDIPGIGSICYPSYNINGTGPASILATYASGDWGQRWVSVPEKEHVQYVIDAMAEVHGKVALDQYTGHYSRRCWVMDEYTGASWASPSIGQHQLYIPEYFKTYNNVSIDRSADHPTVSLPPPPPPPPPPPFPPTPPLPRHSHNGVSTQ